MNTYKLIIAYDGTDYAGWQVQPTGTAVTNILLKTFHTVFQRNPLSLLGASRTDAGVHALGQVARVQLDFAISADALQHAWNSKLPDSIVIRSCQQVENSFHPHVNVAQKTYWYNFFLDRPLPFVARYGHFNFKELDKEKLQQALNAFVGTHDFRSFCTDENRDTLRTIDAISFRYINRLNMYQIEVKGERFLRYMIRRIVGAALEIASRDDLSVDLLRKTLQAKNPEHTLPTAPAKGLLLRKICYK